VTAALVGAGAALPAITGGGHPAAANTGTAVTSARPTGPATRTAPAGSTGTVPAPASLAELLTLLPPGATSHYTLEGLGAEVDLDGASGLGMIRLSLFNGSLNPAACSSAVPSDMTRTCSTLPSGATVLTTTPRARWSRSTYRGRASAAVTPTRSPSGCWYGPTSTTNA
jgi:hypothetical protein